MEAFCHPHAALPAAEVSPSTVATNGHVATVVLAVFLYSSTRRDTCFFPRGCAHRGSCRRHQRPRFFVPAQTVLVPVLSTCISSSLSRAPALPTNSYRCWSFFGVPSGVVTIDQPSHLITARADLCNRISSMIQQADVLLPTISPVLHPLISLSQGPRGRPCCCGRWRRKRFRGWRLPQAWASAGHPAESNTAVQPS